MIKRLGSHLHLTGVSKREFGRCAMPGREEFGVIVEREQMS
jgi:hypothetical protein